MAMFSRNNFALTSIKDGGGTGVPQPAGTSKILGNPEGSTTTTPSALDKPPLVFHPNSPKDIGTDIVAQEILSIIKDEVRDIVKEYAPQIYEAEIYAVLPNAHYDVFLLTDPKNIIHGITSSIADILRPGDRVTIQDNYNNLSTAIIIAKRIPALTENSYASLVGSSALVSSANKDNYLYCDDQKRWWFIFSDTFYDRYLAKYMVDTPQYNADGTPIYETDELGNIIYDDDKHPVILTRKQASLRVGTSRVLSQTSGTGRANWGGKLNDGTRKTYSIPEYIGGAVTKWTKVQKKDKNGNPVVDAKGNPVYVVQAEVNRIRCSTNFTLTARDCDEHPIPMIEVTDIINNFIFCDDYNMRRSARRDKEGKTHYKGDVMFKQFQNYGYWFKRFGLYIKNNAGVILYVTPLSSVYTVQVHEYYEYRKYGISNLTWLGGRLISLSGDLTSSPYTVKNEYIVWKDRATAIMVGDASKKAGSVPYITATMTDSSDPFVVPNEDCLFDPVLLNGMYFEGGKTYTIKVRGKATLTATAVIPAE